MRAEDKGKVQVVSYAWTGAQWLRFFFVVGSLMAIACSAALAVHFNDLGVFERTIGGVATLGFVSYLFGVWG